MQTFVSSVALLLKYGYDLTTQTAAPTHNHPEGIKGAVATVEPAILSFNASTDYVDCLRLAISLGATLTRWPPSQDLWPMPTIRKCPTHWCIRP